MSESDASAPPRRSRLITVPFAMVTASTFAYFMAMGALLPVLPRYVEDGLGGGSVAVGVTVGVFSLAAAALRPFAGRLGDLRGRRLLVVGGSALFGLSVLSYSFVDSLALLIVVRLLTGIGEAAMWVGAATAVQDMAPDDRRGEAASYFSVALYAGLAFGPALGEWVLDRSGFDAVWYSAGGLALVAAVLGLATPKVIAHEQQPFRLLHPTAIAPGFVLLLGLLPFVGFTAFLPLYGPDVGIDDVAPLFVLYGGLVLVIRVVGARLPDRLGWRRASTAALTVLGGAGIMLGLWAATAGVWLATVGLAMGMSLLFPALFSSMVSKVPEAERGQAVGTFSVFFDLASGIGPPVLGVIVALGSYRAGFAAAGLAALGGLALLPRLSARTADPAT
ncbi:MAG: MFS transporter [Microthrixaceae bacterium]